MSAASELSADGRTASLRATIRALTYRYVLALALIAMLASVGFLILQKTIAAHEASSSIINLSARQSTLVQEAVDYAEQLIDADDPSTRAADRARLFESAHAIEQAHRHLTDPDDPLGQPVEASREVSAMYFGPPLHLDNKIRAFVNHAFRLSGARDHDLGADHPSYRYLETAADTLLISLGALVDQLEADARASVRRSQVLESSLLAATLIMLTLEALFIFRPIIRRVGAEGFKLIESQDKLVELAHFDPLTKLANRTLFQVRLDMALSQARRDGTLVAVLQLDLNHFKEVNDTLGHSAGDHLLCEVARRLRRLLRSTDTVARMGGDEFAIILTGLRAPYQVGAVAEKIVGAIGHPVEYGNDALHPAVSVGITIYPIDDDHPEQLLKNADIALYQAKSSGRNSFAFFVGEMKARVERRARVDGDLRRAVAAGGFEVFYQPQVRLADGRLIGLEALLRWRHPEHGLLGPNAFLPVAEETGLIVPIGYIVLRRAIAQMARWTREGIAPARLAINVAGAQLRADAFLDDLGGLLAEHAVEPDRIELEITEGAMIGRSHERVADVLAALHERGVNVALDDFGTGYASLSHLKRVKVDRLKVDRSFVRDIETDPEDAAIVRAVINLGRSLGQEIVAEGVETRAQLDFLRDHGCHLAQGFYFGRPAPAGDLEPLLRRNTPAPEARGQPRLIPVAG